MTRTSGPGIEYADFRRPTLWLAMTLALCCGYAPTVRADLQITEVMFDPVNDDVWKWIEVRNTGGSALDLDGAIAARLDDPNLPDATPFIDGTLTTNTILPAGGVAVLYDADLPGSTNADYLDQLFRDAWGLSSTVPLIGVRAFPDLTAGGSQGYWADFASYQLDLVDDGMGGLKVGGFGNALFSIDLGSGFPAGDGMASISWNGSGNIEDGANWQLSTVVVGAAASGPVNVPGNDVANPGVAPGGTPPSGISITEVLYNPAPFSESTWEWVEIYNNSGSAIDFSDTPYVLDDFEGLFLSIENVTSGMIPDGGVGVLFNGTALSPAQIAGAWDPYGTRNINFIPVANFPGLINSGETIALWPSLEAYEDPNGLGPRITGNAVAVLNYDVDGDWPPSANGASIYLDSFDSDPNDGGANWSLSEGDDAAGSFYVSNVTVLHPGGDVGSPGTFPVIADADFDDDNDVDGNDFLIWQRGFGAGTTHAEGDANDDNLVNAADLAIWEAQYGAAPPLQAAAAVPEPATAGLALLAMWLSLGVLRRS